MLALQASRTRSTGSRWRGALSSPWWSWVRTHAARHSSFPLFCLNHFIVFFAVGILTSFTVWFVLERERKRDGFVCVYTAIFIHKGQTPSFVVLIAESKRRGAVCIPVRIHLDVRSLTLSLSKEAFGLELSKSALSESEMQTFFYSARMWWLTLCQDPPWLMRPYLEGQCILGSKPFPVVGPREFIPSMHLSKASKENCALLMLREWRLSLH